MKLARIGEPGAERPALIDGSGIPRDLSTIVDDINGEVLSGDALTVVRDVESETLPELRGRFGSCVARPGLIVCIGLNYEDHAREQNAKIPTEPILFQKATNTAVGAYDDLLIPRGSTRTDWEVELGVVVGTVASYLPDEDAGWRAIAGYATCNDVSERDFQIERGGQWTKGKSCPTFNPLGPWLVTTDEVEDPMNLTMQTKVNGEVMQDGNTSTMVYNPGYLVYYISQFMTLEPGDLISTGTPPGVGVFMDPPRYLSAGDVVEVTIEGLGSQRQVCRDA